MRQPHVSKASVPRICRHSRITARERNSPSVAVVWIQLV
jgi:hypothetical protein